MFRELLAQSPADVPPSCPKFFEVELFGDRIVATGRMKPTSLLLGAFVAVVFAAAPGAALSAPLPASSIISAVTVYTDRAVVTRTAPLDLPAKGVVEVVFEKLPADLMAESLQVSGRGAAQVSILDVTARAAHVDFTPNERVKVIEDELRALAKQRRVLDDRKALLAAQENSLGKLEAAATSAPTKDSAPRLTIEESAKLLQFLETQRERLATDRQKLETQQEDLTASVGAVQRTLGELRGAGGRTYKHVTVRLDVTQAGKLDLALGYTVPSASWTPGYDARVGTADKTVILAYYGVVRQSTGEDWKDVALTLSTARPALGGMMPRLEAWRLGRDSRPIAYSLPSIGSSVQNNVMGGHTIGNSFMSANVAPKPLERTDTVVSAAVEPGTTGQAFKIAAPASILSDGSTQRVPISTAGMTAGFEYLTTPKLQANAFLVARAANSSGFPLLTGSMSVFLDGTFVATSALRTVMPGESFDLALGVDEAIAVKHQRLRRFVENTGFSGSGQRITYEFLITIKNNKKTPERLRVADQIPLSDNDKIVVKQLAPDAREIKPTAEGLLKWTLDLQPGEKRELSVKFSIDHPRDVPPFDGWATESAVLSWTASPR